jgi:hypothetical protein
LNWIEFYYKIWMAAKSWCFQMFPDVEKMEKMSNVSRCGRQGTTYGPNLVWGGGHRLVCPTALLTPCTYTTLFEILPGPPFFKDFPLGGAFFEKGPFCEIIY